MLSDPSVRVSRVSRIDETFAALPLRALADAALTRASELGCAHADVRIERARTSHRSFRDRELESSSDSASLGLSVRVLHDGVWGFAAGIVLTPDAAAALADRAVATAQVSRPLTPHRVELAD
jgi:TldD protein